MFVFLAFVSNLRALCVPTLIEILILALSLIGTLRFDI